MFFVLANACFWVSKFCLALIEGLKEHFESKMHKYVHCFKLAVLKFGISCMIFYNLLFLLVFFVSTMLGMIMWFVRMKKSML